MRYFLKIVSDQKQHIKMNNQTDKGFDLIILNDVIFDKIINELNYSYNKDIKINMLWELKRKNYFKVYKNIEILKIEDNFNPFKKEIEGKVITFSCKGINFYSEIYSDIGKSIFRYYPNSKIKWKDAKRLYRAIKLSNIKFKN